MTENTKRGARGLILPGTSMIGNPQENVLLPDTVAELNRIAIKPGGGSPRWRLSAESPEQRVRGPAPERAFISGRQEPDSKRTKRRLQHH